MRIGFRQRIRNELAIATTEDGEHAPIMTAVLRPYDYEQQRPAKSGRVVALRPPDWDWAFETDGALALEPESASSLKGQETSVRLLPMARPEAQGLAYRAAQREEVRAKVRRTRRTAALLVAGCVSLVLLLLTAFGTGGVAARVTRGPAPSDRLLPAGPPRAQVIALQDTLRIQMPVNQSRVTAIGYHASGTDVLPLQPVGSQANAGVFRRIFHHLFGQSGSGISYYQLGGGVGPQTGGLDVGAPANTDVYSPVDGIVMAISDQIVDGKAYGVRIDIQPSGNPGVVVTLENLRADPALTVGSTVSSGRTKIGRVIDLSSVEQAALARYTQDKGQHVHIEVRAASGLASP
jgi:murein DD-endopeptidase MepM/ murein hydrolase activator NlpD